MAGFPGFKEVGSRPPLMVCKVRPNGSPNTNWPSWFVADIEKAKHYVRENRREHGAREYPDGREYAVIVEKTGEELARFTVREAVNG